MEINGSRPERGGRPMDPLYFSRSKFEMILREIGNAHVVKCPAGKIVAYALVPKIGDLWTVDYVLGHGDHLNSGIMYLLMTHVIEEKFELAKTVGNPQWIMYDTCLAPALGCANSKRSWVSLHIGFAGGGPDQSSAGQKLPEAIGS